MGDRSDGDELPGMASINHDPCYHELHDVLNTFIVLVFSELTSFVRKILQREENKGGRAHYVSVQWFKASNAETPWEPGDLGLFRVARMCNNYISSTPTQFGLSLNG